MTKIAFMFPGQGSFESGMGHDVAEALPEAMAVYDEASLASGMDLKDLCFNRPAEDLVHTEVQQPALVTTSLALDAALRSAVLGLAAYGAYDLTNLAIVRDWPLRISMIDWAWGAVICAAGWCNVERPFLLMRSSASAPPACSVACANDGVAAGSSNAAIVVTPSAIDRFRVTSRVGYDSTNESVGVPRRSKRRTRTARGSAPCARFLDSTSDSKVAASSVARSSSRNVARASARG